MNTPVLTYCGQVAITLCMVLAVPMALHAATATWDNDSSDGTWTTKANWSNNGAGIVSGDTAVFTDAAVGSSTMDMSSMTVGKLAYTNSSGTHTLTLSNPLTINALDAGYESTSSSAIIQNGSLQLAGTVRIGYCNDPNTTQNAAGNVTLNNVAFTSGNIGDVEVGYSYISTGTLLDYATGTWDMSGSHNGVFNNQGGGEFVVGATRTGAITPITNSGVVKFGTNWNISIGTPASLTDFKIGYSGNGTVTAGNGGSFTGYLSTFTFGKQGNASLDLSGINNGFISINASGGLIGDGNYSTTGTTANLQLGTNWTIVFNGGTFGFGHNGAMATVTAPNLALTGTLSRFYVGTSPSGSGIGGQATLVVGGLGSGLTVGDLWVGSHYASAVGNLTLPAGDFTLSGGTYLGSGGTGTVTLVGTRMKMTQLSGTPLNIGAGGRVNVTVGTRSCGPDIDYTSKYAVGISSTTNTGGGLMINFTGTPTVPYRLGSVLRHDSIVYGFKWAGNHTSTADSRELGYLINNRYVSWNASALRSPFSSAVSMFYDTATDATYIGYYLQRQLGTVVCIQ